MGGTCPFDRDGISAVLSFKEFRLYLNYQICSKGPKSRAAIVMKIYMQSVNVCLACYLKKKAVSH